MWSLYTVAVLLLVTYPCLADRSKALRLGRHPKRSEEETSLADGAPDLDETSRQLKELRGVLVDLEKVLEIIGEKEEDILDAESQLNSANQQKVKLTMVPSPEDTAKDGKSELELQLARILSQGQGQQQVDEGKPSTLPEPAADPTPRRAAEDADGDERMFKRILAKYMQHELDRDARTM